MQVSPLGCLPRFGLHVKRDRYRFSQDDFPRGTKVRECFIHLMGGECHSCQCKITHPSECEIHHTDPLQKAHGFDSRTLENLPLAKLQERRQNANCCVFLVMKELMRPIVRGILHPLF